MIARFGRAYVQQIQPAAELDSKTQGMHKGRAVYIGNVDGVRYASDRFSIHIGDFPSIGRLLRAPDDRRSIYPIFQPISFTAYGLVSFCVLD